MSVTADIVEILAQFKAELLWDEIVGIFEQVPQSVKSKLLLQYDEALKAASQKLKIPKSTLEFDVEQLAYARIDGQSFGPNDITARLAEYGIAEQSS